MFPSRSRLFGALVGLLAFACLNCCRPLLAQPPAGWQERFTKEAPQGWEQYRARAGRVQGSFSWTTVLLAPEKRTMTDRRCEIKQAAGGALWLTQSAAEGGKASRTGSLRAVNPQYAFQLHRDAPDGPWVISEMDLTLSDGVSFNSPTKEVGFWSTYALYLFSDMLPDMVKQPEFKVRAVSAASSQGSQWVKLEYDYRAKDIKRKPLRGGWVLLDPDHHWVIRQYEVEVEWWQGDNKPGAKGTVAGTYEYGEGDDGLLLLRRVIQKHKPIEREDRFEFTLAEADADDDEFYLSAYGFPEPPGVRRPTPWYLWAALVGVVCVVLALAAHRFARRTEITRSG